MHITLEADYALRIMDVLARTPRRMEARAISEKACVTLRFSLKILRKLVSQGIVRSYRGARGGYQIAKPLEEITVCEVLETIEGPLVLNRCVLDSNSCTRTSDKRCPYHYLFEHLTDHVRAQLSAVTLASVVNSSTPDWKANVTALI